MHDVTQNFGAINGTVFRDSQCESPQYVIRGAKHEMSVGIDWLRMSGPWSMVARIIEYLERTFGMCPGEERRGRWFYDKAYVFSNGVSVLYNEAKRAAGDPNATCCVDIPGNVLRVAGWLDAMLIICRLRSFGMKATRVDIAVDFRGYPSSLFECAKHSCDAGELCKATAVDEHYSRCRGELVGRTLMIGRRGKQGSGRYVRIYDKGLERDPDEFAMGEWERFEVEFTGDCAAQVAETLVDNFDGREMSGQWASAAVDMAFGSIDFRQGDSRRAFSERPRCAWWQAVLDGREGVTIRERREPTKLEGFQQWVRRSVAPTLMRMAEAVDWDLPAMFEALIGEAGVDYQMADESRPVIWEWMQLVRELGYEGPAKAKQLCRDLAESVGVEWTSETMRQ